MNVFVLTRTSERPHFFAQNHNSISTQTYPHIKHIISYDTDNTKKYLEQYSNIEFYAVDRIKRTCNAHFPYNLYCNELQQKLNNREGWVLYLDDDDIFTTNTAVEEISQYFNNPDNLIIWKVRFPKAVLPDARHFGKRVMRSGFPSICFCFHTKWLKHAIWDDYKGSDSRVLHALYKAIPKRVWIDNILTAINYNTGCGGYGHQNDVC